MKRFYGLPGFLPDILPKASPTVLMTLSMGALGEFMFVQAAREKTKASKPVRQESFFISSGIPGVFDKQLCRDHAIPVIGYQFIHQFSVFGQ